MQLNILVRVDCKKREDGSVHVKSIAYPVRAMPSHPSGGMLLVRDGDNFEVNSVLDKNDVELSTIDLVEQERKRAFMFAVEDCFDAQAEIKRLDIRKKKV